MPFADFDTNAVGTMNMLEATRQFAAESPFVHMSTNKVYGDTPNYLPLKELETRWEYADDADFGGIRESLSIDQCKHSLFGASKVAADIMVQEYGRYFDMPTCCLRGGCLTGPNHSGVELHGFGGAQLPPDPAAERHADAEIACIEQQALAHLDLVLVATGVPHASTFRGRQRLAVSLFARSLGPLTRLVGYYPGQRLGFAGREAGGVMRDWAATVRSGRYLDYTGDGAMDAALARLALPVLGLRFARDWLVPAASLEALLGKLGPGPRRVEVFDDARLGARADHFRWMKAPDAPAGAIAAGLLSP